VYLDEQLSVGSFAAINTRHSGVCEDYQVPYSSLLAALAAINTRHSGVCEDYQVPYSSLLAALAAINTRHSGCEYHQALNSILSGDFTIKNTRHGGVCHMFRLLGIFTHRVHTKQGV